MMWHKGCIITITARFRSNDLREFGAMRPRSILAVIIFLAGILVACQSVSPGPAPPTGGTTAVAPGPPPPTAPAAVSPAPKATSGGPGRVYYVRRDGGSEENCTGLADTPYPGSGSSQACAWDHPFRALPPGGTPRLAGGDTLIIGTGSYMMGYGAPGSQACDRDGAWECTMPPIPGGPAPSRPTRILGAGWDTRASSPPELWGTERADFILNLTDSSNVELAYLEITDHSECVEFHSGSLACNRDNLPFGPWARVGLYAEDSAGVHLRDLNIHGLAHGGVWAGRLTNWTVDRVRIAGNGSVGWDGDIEGDDSDSGTMLFRRWTVEWNGCGETYPGGKPVGCWAQEAGGYGDGVGFGNTQGHWVIEDSAFRYNTSDGLDLLYAVPGSSIEIRRTIAQGNAGNQIKTSGPVTVENSVIVGNCGFFDGQPFTFKVDQCRALGASLAINLYRGDSATVLNNTIAGEGDCLVVAELNGPESGTETVRLRNNLLQGHTDFLQPFEKACAVYQETFSLDPFDIDYSIVNDVKNDDCPGGHPLCGVPAGLANAGVDSFDARLLPGSPAIDAGVDTGLADDFAGARRPQGARYDIGAYEFAGGSSR